jgi:hypothetical protein
MKKLLFLLLIPIFCSAETPVLSEKAEIFIATCGPYQDELYSAFGHSAIRVYDPKNGVNTIYNYGVFDYDQPNFYLNFARGNLNYQVSRMNYGRFIRSYIRENRYVHEQVLNLTSGQKQRVFEYLEWNAQPENKNYLYDYFYNNCATKLKDVIVSVLGDSVVFDTMHLKGNYTIRELTDLYLKEQAWGDLGIDICLGLPMDKEASADVYMFLPDYLEIAFNHASIMDKNGELRPLVKNTLLTNEVKPTPKKESHHSPLLYTSEILILGLVITYFQRKDAKRWVVFDCVLFGVAGIVGWLLFLLWVATEHQAAANNMNLLWAIPLHFPVCFFILKKTYPFWIKRYFQISMAVYGLTLLNWFWLPQKLHYALIPLVVLLGIRSFMLAKRVEKK